MLLYVFSAAQAEPITVTGGAKSVSSYELAGLTELTGLPPKAVLANAAAGGVVCGLPVSNGTAKLLVGACPQAFQISPDAELKLDYVDKDGASVGSASIKLQPGYSAGGPWIIPVGPAVTLPEGATDKVSFQVEGRTWYRAKAEAGRLVPETKDGAASLAEWARSTADVSVRVRKVLESTEQEWQIRHARPEQPANVVSELDWTEVPAPTSRPISFLMSFKVVKLPAGSTTVQVASVADPRVSCDVGVANQSASIDALLCRKVLESADKGLALQPRHNSTNVGTAITLSATDTKPETVPVRPSELPKLPSWFVAHPTVAWRTDDEPWMTGTLQANTLSTSDPLDANKLQEWLKGSTKDLRIRARASDTTLREGEWVFKQGPGPTRRDVSSATLSLAEDTIWQASAAELANGTIKFSGTSPIAVYRNGTYIGSTHASGSDQELTAKDLPAAFALSATDTLTFSGTRASLVLTPASQSYAATRREGSPDLREHLLIPEDTNEITIRRGSGPWTQVWLRAKDVSEREMPAEIVEQCPRCAKRDNVTVPPLVETWKIEADPALPLHVRWKEGDHEVERIVTWDGTPDWCQAGPSDPSAWARGRDLTYVVCFDVKGGVARPILPTGVPILYPNQPIAVVIRAPDGLAATVTVGGKAGIERGGASLPATSVAGAAIDRVEDVYGAKTSTSTWHFAPRTRAEPIAVTIAPDATGKGANSIDLLVRPVYSSAIRVGLGASIVLGERSFAEVGQPGTDETFLGEQQSPFVPEVVVGYMMSTQRTPREDAFPRLRPVNLVQRLAPYVGIGVIGPATTLGTESIPLDFFTTLHAGVDVELSPSASIAFTHVIHRSASLWEGWSVGDPYPEGPAPTAVTYRPGVAIVLNVSPKFFRFAQSFAANPAAADLEE